VFLYFESSRLTKEYGMLQFSRYWDRMTAEMAESTLKASMKSFFYIRAR
jgi:hypothetical protein